MVFRRLAVSGSGAGGYCKFCLGAGYFTVPDCNDQGIGTGKKNTLLISSYETLLNKGADLRGEYYTTNNGTQYKDRFVPSFDELRMMRTTLRDNSIKRAQYHFIETWYWSSNQENDNSVNVVGFVDGGTVSSEYTKTNTYPLRPIRAFSGPEPTHIVVYDVNNASSGYAPIDARYFPEGGSVVVKAKSRNLVRTGFEFAGWDTQADGAGTH